MRARLTARMSSRRSDDRQSARVPVGAPEGAVTISGALGLSQQAETPTHAPYVRFTPQYLVPRVASNVVDEVFADHDVATGATMRQHLVKGVENVKNAGKALTKGAEGVRSVKKGAKSLIQRVGSRNLEDNLKAARDATRNAWEASKGTARYHLAGLASFDYSIAPGTKNAKMAMLGVRKKGKNGKTLPEHTLRPFSSYSGEDHSVVMAALGTQEEGMTEYTPHPYFKSNGEKMIEHTTSSGREAACMGFTTTTVHNQDFFTKKFGKNIYDPDGAVSKIDPAIVYIEATNSKDSMHPITGLVIKELDTDDFPTSITHSLRADYACCIQGLHVGHHPMEGTPELQMGPMILVPHRDKINQVNKYGIFDPDGAYNNLPEGVGIGIGNALACAMEMDGIDLTFLWAAYEFAVGASELKRVANAETEESLKFLFPERPKGRASKDNLNVKMVQE